MRPPTFTTALLVAIGSVALSGCVANTPANPPAATVLSLQAVREKGIIGQLGKPLGTMVVVSGKAVANHTRRKADAGEPLFLQITAVNGNALPEPVEFPFRKAADFIDVPLPKIGDAFEYRGYETGGYRGVPLNSGVAWQAAGFYFYTEFLILPKN